ncbi:tRNA pseudouridine(13) synthase TruD [Candidatus Woesearchaeota archaeon]|nr:tRNA pseudouridine(13) synthase TruD [Candidatus Woesearchaeota archaeon]
MKIKQIPQDFIVEEISTVELLPAGQEGAYAIYRLTKTGIDTFAAKKIIANRLKISYNLIGIAGLKDRHAHTIQYISIQNIKSNKDNNQRGNLTAVPSSFSERNIKIERIGYSSKPIKLGDIAKNKFTIVVRDIKKGAIDSILMKISQVRRTGVPNYFDAQRFGSIRNADEFIAKMLVKSDYEAALKIFLTTVTRFNPMRIKKIRRFISINWGKWNDCISCIKENSPNIKGEIKILQHLIINNNDYRGAFNLINKDLLILYCSAYQSFLWNECLKQILRKYIDEKNLLSIEYPAGRLLFFKSLDDSLYNRLNSISIPILAHNLEFKDNETDSEIKQAYARVLEKQGLTFDDVRKNQNVFFKVSYRKTLVNVQEMRIELIEHDELNTKRVMERHHRQPEKKFKIRLSFMLDKGCYATLILKRIFPYDLEYR